MRCLDYSQTISNHGQYESKWILGSAKTDLLWFYLPALLLVSIGISIKVGHWPLLSSYEFVVLILLDVGHTFSTNWRTYFRKEEFNRRKEIYMILPIVFFSAAAYIAISPNGVRNIANAMLIIVPFHGIQQSYGILKWYQRKNGVFRPWSDRFFHALHLMPFSYLIYVNPAWNQFAIKIPMLLAKDSVSTLIGTLNVFAIFAYLIYEIILWQTSREWNRILITLFSALLLNGAIVMPNPMEFTLAFKIFHAVAYFAIISASTKRIWPLLEKGNIFKAPSKFTLIFYCSIPAMLIYPIQKMNDSLWGPLAIGFLFGNFCLHVAYDSFLWKRTNPDAAIIYG